MFRLSLCILLFLYELSARPGTDSATAFPSKTPDLEDTLFLNVTRPDSDTIRIAVSRYRVAACTRSDAHAFINNREVKVYESGAFVSLEEMKYGVNNLRFAVKNASGDSLWREYIVIRQEPLKNSPHDTLVIESEMMEPSQDMWLTTDDILDVRFKGSPGWDATFDIPEIESGLPMRELTPKEAGGLSGIYAGSYKIKSADEVHDAQIKFRLKKSFWSKEKAYTTAKISVLPQSLPQVAEIVGQRPFLNTGLGNDRLGGSKLGFLQNGVYVEITGKVGPQYRVRLSESMEAWLPEEYARLLPPGTSLPRSLTGSIAVFGNGNEDIVMIGLSERLPYSSDQSVNPNEIIVDIYGATSNTNWISYDSTSRYIENVTWKQVARDQFQMIIGLKHSSHWGYDIDYIGNLLRIKIRRPPLIVSREYPLKGMIIAVDAGHGGENRGAIGATGALEKDITISIAHALDSILTLKGAKVVLTRDEDNSPGMLNRINRVVNSGAQMLVSIHCNSSGDNADPVAVQGTSTYYRYIGYKKLADIIFDKMAGLGLKQFGVIGSFNFSLNSLTQMPNVLVETAFISNPEDEILLLNPEFRKKIALQIYSGFEEYIRKFGENVKK
jgi:N-acetylmuramoyl-L-alanine amidase